MTSFHPVDLARQVVVITGGMGQLGMEYATGFADCGARVAIFDVTETPKLTHPRFHALFDEGVIRGYKVNITDPASVKSAVKDVIETWGKPAVLVNNAALDSPPDAPPEEVGPFESYPLTSFNKVMEVNVTGTLICSQILGSIMADEGKGAIINVSSIYGILSPCQDIYDFRRRQGGVFFKPVAYSVSKSAILNLSRYLATYWAERGVRVNTLTLAGVFNNQSKEFLDAYCSRLPLKRMAQASEYVGPVLFLASDASSYMTGSNLVVDGGWSAW